MQSILGSSVVTFVEKSYCLTVTALQETLTRLDMKRYYSRWLEVEGRGWKGASLNNVIVG